MGLIQLHEEDAIYNLWLYFKMYPQNKNQQAESLNKGVRLASLSSYYV